MGSTRHWRSHRPHHRRCRRAGTGGGAAQRGSRCRLAVGAALGAVLGRALHNALGRALRNALVDALCGVVDDGAACAAPS